MTTTTYSANDVLMGGGGAPTWKFPDVNTTKTGTITAPPTTRQETEYDPNNPGGGAPKFFPSGDPIMGILVEVQTDERDPSIDNDTGVRTFYIEGKRLKDATRSAVRNAGASGLEVGGKLTVTLTHYDVAGDRRSGRNWQIVYTPAGNNALMGDQPAEAAPAAPQQPAPQVQQPAPQQAPAPTPAAQGTAPAMTPEQQQAWEAWQQQRAQQG